MRDFEGYRNQPPAVCWPQGARVAVSFVLNFEEGAELSVADGDARNEAVYEAIDPLPGRDPCIDSHFEYGTRAAWWRIADTFGRWQAPMTVSACGRAVERSPWLAQDAGLYLIDFDAPLDGKPYVFSKTAPTGESRVDPIFKRGPANLMLKAAYARGLAY